MRSLNLVLITLFIGCISCGSSSNKGGNPAGVDEKQMLEQGYTKGEIVASEKEGDCPYVISVVREDQSKIMFDPINLEEAYMVNGEEVWFKYGVLRMMNRCDKASPINILEIKKDS